jgi:O-antigen ligase
VTSPVLVSPEPLLASTHDVSLRRRWNAAILFGATSLVLFEPLAFGGVEPWAIFVFQVGAALLFLSWLAKQSVLKESQIVSNPLFAPMLVFGLLIGGQWAFGLTAYRYVTGSRFLLYCAYGMLVFVMTQSLRRGSQSRQLATVATIYGSAVALFALVQGAASNGRIYWVRSTDVGGWIYGPYVNHNHYAGLMEMLVPIPLVFFLTSFASGTRKLMAGLAVVLMASTIFLSGSRGGMIAFILEIAFLVVVTRAKEQRRRTALLAGLALLVSAALVYWMEGREFAQRVMSIHSETHFELAGGTRISILKDALRIFTKRPIFGWGFGTFSVIYPQFRSFYSGLSIDQAHNDYLQWLVETGLLGLVIVGWFLLRLFRAALKKIEDWASNPSAAASLAALLGCVGILVHSLFDFNLQIPANATLFFVLAALAAAPAFQEPSHRRKHRSRIPSDSWEPMQPVPVAEPLLK